jgi:hypothetical protein
MFLKCKAKMSVIVVAVAFPKEREKVVVVVCLFFPFRLQQNMETTLSTSDLHGSQPNISALFLLFFFVTLAHTLPVFS